MAGQLPNRRQLRTILAALIVGVPLVAIVSYGVSYARHLVYDVVPNCYAVEWVACMVIDRLETHANTWPTGWDDLRDSYENVAKQTSHPRPPEYPWSFDELRARVDVDWSADPRHLLETADTPGQRPFKLIWLRDGSQSHWQSAEPNQMVLDYLKKNNGSIHPDRETPRESP